MSRKVYLDVKVKMVIDAEEGVDISNVIDEMDYDFKSENPKAEIIQTEIDSFTITDSK
jgi:hypothetical protein